MNFERGISLSVWNRWFHYDFSQCAIPLASRKDRQGSHRRRGCVRHLAQPNKCLSPVSGCKNLIRAKREERDDQESVYDLISRWSVCFGVLSITGPVQAKDAGDWTCSDFLKLSNAVKSRIVYYMVGLNKAQMKEFHDISAKDFDVPVSKVVQHCHSNLPENLWRGSADHFYWHAQQMP